MAKFRNYKPNRITKRRHFGFFFQCKAKTCQRSWKKVVGFGLCSMCVPSGI